MHNLAGKLVLVELQSGAMHREYTISGASSNMYAAVPTFTYVCANEDLRQACAGLL